MRKLLFVMMALLFVLAGCNSTPSSKSEKHETLTVSAAASLTDVTKDLEKAFKKKNPNINVEFNYGGSGALRTQIEKGAPADVFMSANTKDVEQLKSSDKVKDTYDYAQNTLVLIQKEGQHYKSVRDLKQDDKLAIGEIESVPAGRYAKTYLESQNDWQFVQPHLVYAKDVREVLNYVSKGNAQLGFVYETDLYVGDAKHQGVEKVTDVQLEDPIIYRMGIVSDKDAAHKWFAFLKSDEAKEILKQYHFKV
ncbi:molybdate ABC transporter substrate-binding protein [Staphylococcus canis]|uniref:Molybdate ABC transporter substrate-binding protein n=1 Tax=Staphylococcus canis TaxID=2724942 RepID=A0ABS0TA21_9STAP|nr:molybdate ABC transporter substrate-binding protein [Staphylococcus canis]MBI5974623.1 molybdate ABC transporter substrate-binding protein [Staphylococcus canis]